MVKDKSNMKFVVVDLTVFEELMIWRVLMCNAVDVLGSH
jgi:hypothetical protein